ncbi:MAG: aspartate kinase [Bacillota bacterium]
MLTVEKIGGTSMSHFRDVFRNIIKNKDGGITYNRIFVVSAYNNVTNWLLEDKKTGAPGVYTHFANRGDYERHLMELEDKLLEINKELANLGLDLKEADTFIKERIGLIRNHLSSMAEVMGTGYVDRRSILQAAREMLASVGESHSAFNTANIINNNNIRAILVDLSGVDDSEPLTIDERIHRSFQNIDFSKNLVIATGYTKGTEGIMREFDRGYSEVTFSKVAVEVKAREAIIHKEYHLSSADPKIVGEKNAIPVGFTNYDVTDQLADIGMEAIHPKASKPLETAGINLRIKNTFDPYHDGTLITKDYVSKESKIEIIAGTDKALVLDIHDSSMVGEVGFDLDIMEIFKKYGISYIVKATNANSISLVIWENKYQDALGEELRKSYQQLTMEKVAILCLIGSNIAKPGIFAKASRVLAEEGINIICISQSMRQVNIQLIINREDFNRGIIALNKALCLT